MSHFHHRYLPRKAKGRSTNTKIIVDKPFREKSMIIAYLLWMISGVVGGHRIYLERYVAVGGLFISYAILYIGLLKLGVDRIEHIPYGIYLLMSPRLITIPWKLSLIYVCLLPIIDLFWTASAVRKHNHSVESKLRKRDDLSQISYPSEPR